MMKIGVTGQFLSGKSEFSKYLSVFLGYELFNSDEYVADLYKKAEVKKKIVDSFGKMVYKDGQIQKKILSQIVFSSADKLQQLELLLLPYVELEIKRIVGDGDRQVLFEIPLLYEKGLNQLMDCCMLVICDHQKKIERALKRGFNEEDLNQRLKFQWSDEQKKTYHPVIVENQLDLNHLKNTALAVAKDIKNKTVKKTYCS